MFLVFATATTTVVIALGLIRRLCTAGRDCRARHKAVYAGIIAVVVGVAGISARREGVLSCPRAVPVLPVGSTSKRRTATARRRRHSAPFISITTLSTRPL
jgi:hypothetical protein